ncbi:MAG: hypothetical protein ACK4K6_17260 [Pseudarthrobacter sp.]
MESGFFWQWSLLAMVVQVITEIAQRLGLKRHTLLLAVAVGLAVAVTTRTGLLDGFGVEVWPPWVDYGFMAFALAGGGWAADLLKKFMQAKVNGSANGHGK